MWALTLCGFTSCAQQADRLGWAQCSGLAEMLSAHSVAAVSPGTWKSTPSCSRLTHKYTANQQNPALHTAVKSALSCRELRTYSEPVCFTDIHEGPGQRFWCTCKGICCNSAVAPEMLSSSFAPQMEGIHCTLIWGTDRLDFRAHNNIFVWGKG